MKPENQGDKWPLKVYQEMVFKLHHHVLCPNSCSLTAVRWKQITQHQSVKLIHRLIQYFRMPQPSVILHYKHHIFHCCSLYSTQRLQKITKFTSPLLALTNYPTRLECLMGGVRLNAIMGICAPIAKGNVKCTALDISSTALLQIIIIRVFV